VTNYVTPHMLVPAPRMIETVRPEPDPAAALFGDWDTLCREATLEFYELEFGLREKAAAGAARGCQCERDARTDGTI